MQVEHWRKLNTNAVKVYDEFASNIGSKKLRHLIPASPALVTEMAGVSFHSDCLDYGPFLPDLTANIDPNLFHH